jgi:hypothetical protein
MKQGEIDPSITVKCPRCGNDQWCYVNASQWMCATTYPGGDHAVCGWTYPFSTSPDAGAKP